MRARLAPAQRVGVPVLVFGGRDRAGQALSAFSVAWLKLPPTMTTRGGWHGPAAGGGASHDGDRAVRGGDEQVHQPGQVHVVAVAQRMRRHVPGERQRREPAARQQRSSAASTACCASASPTAFQCVPPAGNSGNGYASCAARNTAVVSATCTPASRSMASQAGSRPVRSAGREGQLNPAAAAPGTARPWTGSARTGTPCPGAPRHPASAGCARPRPAPGRQRAMSREQYSSA